MTLIAVGLAASIPAGSALAIFTSQATVTANTVSTAASFPVCYRDAVLADTPVGYWRLDETSGTSAVDSKNGRNGTYTNGVTLGQSGALPDTSNNKAASFDGVNDYVNVPYAAALNPATFTVEGWAKVTGGQGTWRTVAATEDDNNNKGYWLGVGDDNTWRFQIAPTSAHGSWSQVYGPLVTLNDWVHVVGTYDGSTARLYLNGVLIGSVSATIGVNTVRPMGIGAYSGSGSTWDMFLVGQLDEVALYNTVLSVSQIRTHYNTGRCYKDGVLADSPVGYWRLGESSGATAADAFRRDGTYAGAPTLGQTGALNGDSNTAVTFNGSSQYVSVPYDSALNPAQFTVEAWAKPTGGPADYRAVASSWKCNPNCYGYWLGIDPSGLWTIYITNNSNYGISNGPVATYGAWAHLVATYNGSTLKLYVNGILAASTTTSSYASAYNASNSPVAFVIGAQDGPGFYFTGQIDDVALYNAALSQTRVQAHYLLGRSYNDTVLDSGPVSYWRLGEGSGTSAADSKGANTGTYTNGPVLAQTGALAGDADTAVSFDGSNDYVTRAYTAALNPAQFTVEAWVDPTGGQNTWRTAVGSWASAGGGSENGWWLGISGDDNTWRWQIGNNASTNQVYGPAPTLNTWTHVVGTYDGTTARLYLNGAAAGSVAASYIANTVRPTVIGAYQPSAGGYQMFLPGLIDDVAVYNRALTATEVQLHYDSGRQ